MGRAARLRKSVQRLVLAREDERRRIRRRDGALNWRLLRDLADPEVWIERYETPTWLDYVRLNSCMTRHDAVIVGLNLSAECETAPFTDVPVAG